MSPRPRSSGTTCSSSSRSTSENGSRRQKALSGVNAPHSDENSDESDGSVSSKFSTASVPGDITPVMKLPFPVLRNIYLSGVYWGEVFGAGFSTSWNLRVVSLTETALKEDELAWLFEGVKGPLDLSLHWGHFPYALEILLDVRPNLRCLSVHSQWYEKRATTQVRIDQKLIDHLMEVLQECDNNLQVFDIIQPTVSLAQLPVLPSLKHLHLKLHDLDDFLKDWSVSPNLESIEITLERSQMGILPETEAAFIELYTTDRTRIRTGDSCTTLVDRYIWDNTTYDSVLGFAEA